MHSDDSELPREIKWQRLGGLALLGLLVGPLIYGTQVAAPNWLASPSVVNAIWAASVFVLGGNTAAIGLALLLAGLGNRSVANDRQARRALLVRMAASNVLLFSILLAAAIAESDFIKPYLDSDDGVAAAEFSASVLFIYVIRSAALLYRSSWKYEAPSLDAALRVDERPPVLYLRSFVIDDKLLSGPSFFSA